MGKKRFKVGQYIIGSECIDLDIRAGDGGEFYFVPAMGEVPRVVVGIDDNFSGVLGVFIHEIFEYVMTKNRLRWLMTEDLSNDHSGYTFIMTHPEFSDCCNRLTEGLLSAQLDLEKAWKSWHKELKRKAKKNAKRKRLTKEKQ